MSLEDEQTLMSAAEAAAYRYLTAHPGVAAHQADDVVSDARFGAALAYPRHDAAKGASLYSFALRRATGAIADGVRHRSPMNRDEYRANPDQAEVNRRTPTSLDALIDDGWSPSHPDVVECTADYDEAMRLLRLCAPRERIALVAVVMHGYTQTEVAGWLGLSVSAVCKAMHSGLARLHSEVAA